MDYSDFIYKLEVLEQDLNLINKMYNFEILNNSIEFKLSHKILNIIKRKRKIIQKQNRKKILNNFEYIITIKLYNYIKYMDLIEPIDKSEILIEPRKDIFRNSMTDSS